MQIFSWTDFLKHNIAFEGRQRAWSPFITIRDLSSLYNSAQKAGKSVFKQVAES